MAASRWVFVGALAIVSLNGCYSYYPYAPHWQGGYPGQYSPIVPQDGSVVPQGQLPGNAQAFHTIPPQWQVPQPAASDAPRYNPGSRGSSDVDNLVPDYDDTEDAGRTENDAFFNEEGASLERVDSGIELAANLTPASEDEFLEPVPFQPVSAESPAPIEDAASPNPYDYDRNGYTWLRGVVEFEPGTKSWHILYNDIPEQDDPYGGSIELVDVPSGTVESKDVVLLQGFVDAADSDSNGKPRYRVEQLAKLVPTNE